MRVLQVGLDPQSSLEVLAGLGFDTPPDRTVSRLLMPEEFGDTPELDAVVHETRVGHVAGAGQQGAGDAPSARSARPAAAAPANGSSAASSASTSTSASTSC